MKEELTCNDCEHYDPWEGVCLIDGENYYGDEDACEKFDKEKDTERI